MAKKIIQSAQRKIKTRNQSRDLTNNELKTMAIKKIRQLQNGKKAQTKISKRGFEQDRNKKQQTRVQKQLFEQILNQSVFQCPVCLQLMIEPTLLECGHAYCFKCLEELMIYKSCCGVCRNVQNEPQFQRSKHLETMIQSMILKKSQNYLDYYCRVTDTQNWKRVRNIPIQQLTKGVFIDFRDKQLKWRKAQIIKLTLNQTTCQYEMVVKYKKDGQPVEQMIQSDSGRYTKFSYYTRMKYLQPRNNCNSMMMEQFVQGQVMDIPFVGVEGIRENYGEIDIMRMVVQDDDSGDHPLSSNIMSLSYQHQPQFQNYYNNNNEQDKYLDQLFNNNNNQMQPIDLIELLA